MADRLPDDVGATVERWVGPVFEVRERSWPHQVTRVWQLWASDEVFWLKRHTQARKFAQESRAYDLVAPALARLGHLVPEKIAEEARARLLLLTDIPGRPACDYPGAGHKGEEDPEVHRRAGVITRALHDLPLDEDDPVPLSEAIRHRADRWLKEAEPVLSPEIAARVREEVGDGSAFLGCRRVWCHRDWSPRNWIVAEDGRFGMIDFEHCNPDLSTVDLVKLCCDVWRRYPETEGAFYEGYGHTPDASERDRLRRLLWLHAISTISWATAHRDPSFERQGRGLLAALASGWRP